MIEEENISKALAKAASKPQSTKNMFTRKSPETKQANLGKAENPQMRSSFSIFNSKRSEDRSAKKEVVTYKIDLKDQVLMLKNSKSDHLPDSAQEYQTHQPRKEGLWVI